MYLLTEWNECPDTCWCHPQRHPALSPIIGMNRATIHEFFMVIHKQAIPCRSTSSLGAIDKLFKAQSWYPFSVVLLPTQLVQLMWPKLLSQSIPFTILPQGLGPYISAMTVHVCTLYKFWDIFLLKYYFYNRLRNRPPILWHLLL